jgi:hypothetical protein
VNVLLFEGNCLVGLLGTVGAIETFLNEGVLNEQVE